MESILNVDSINLGILVAGAIVGIVFMVLLKSALAAARHDRNQRQLKRWNKRRNLH